MARPAATATWSLAAPVKMAYSFMAAVSPFTLWVQFHQVAETLPASPEQSAVVYCMAVNVLVLHWNLRDPMLFGRG